MRKFLWGFVAGILLLPLTALAGAWLGLLPTTANSAPPAWERAIARTALDSAAARNAPHLVNPVAPTDENLLAGMKIYRNACSGCHGDASQSSDYGASFYPNVPQFASDPPRNPDWQLFWIVRNGVRYSGMSAWEGQWGKDASGHDISDQKIWTVVTFLSRLRNLPPAVDAQWRAKPAAN
jgi:mono/diheme cytochrome c family protein